LAEHVDVDPERLSPVLNHISMRINLYYFSLIRQAGDSLRRQAVLDPTELADRLGSSDP
jgi:L-lysine 2,3-aminomutase